MKIKILEKGLRKYFGYAYKDNKGEAIVEIAKGLKDKEYMGTLIHEILHILYPNDSEYNVDQNARVLTRYLWEQGFRRNQ